MEAILGLCKHLNGLKENSQHFLENWVRISISGTFFNETVRVLLIEISSFAEKLKILDAINLRIDSDYTPLDKVASREISNEFQQQWKLDLSKEKIYTTQNADGVYFYICKESFHELTKKSPFVADHPFRQNLAVRILVWNLGTKIIGPRIFIHDQNEISRDVDWPRITKIPGEHQIRSVVHITSSIQYQLSPAPFLIEEISTESEVGYLLMQASYRTLLASIVHEFQSEECVIIRGIRRLELKLQNDTNLNVTISDLQLLKATVEWIYEERTTTRALLFLDRIALEMKHQDNLMATTLKFVKYALLQAKEQYEFVILEKRDEYLNELQNVLSDLRKQADLYTGKIRSLLSSFLRDILAALFLIGVSLFAKAASSSNLETSIIIMVGKSFSIFFAISVILQILVIIPDVRSSKKALSQWLQSTKIYLSNDEITGKFAQTIRPRETHFWIMLAILITAYISVAVLAWNLQCILELFDLS